MKKYNITELRKIFEDTTSEKNKKIALTLLEKAEFMNKTLKDLEEKIKDNGVVTKMCQGKYEIERENPALRSYNTTVKNYMTIMKQLNDMIPQENDFDDGFDDFGND